MALILDSTGLAKHPDGLMTKPVVEVMQGTAIAIVGMSATVYAIITDASGWTTLLQQQTSAQGGFTLGLVAGTVTVPRAMTVKVCYRLSGITVIDGITRQFAVFGGSAGTTNKGGDSLGTDLTAMPSTYAGVTVFTAAAGDIISLKGIQSDAGTFTMASLGGTVTVEEV